MELPRSTTVIATVIDSPVLRLWEIKNGRAAEGHGNHANFISKETNYVVTKDQAKMLLKEIESNSVGVRTVTVKIDKEKIGSSEYYIGTISKIEK